MCEDACKQDIVHEVASVRANVSQCECRHTSGTFGMPFCSSHPFRLVLPGWSTASSYVQRDGGQPCWQNPQGTKSQVSQLSEEVGYELGFADGDADSDGCDVGSLLGVQSRVGVQSRHSRGKYPKFEIPFTRSHPLRSVLSADSS